MSKIIFVIALFSFSLSNSQDLSKSQAQKIIQNCINSEPFYKYEKIPANISDFKSTFQNSEYSTYHQQGLIDLETIKQDEYNIEYKVSLTEKGILYSNRKVTNKQLVILWTHVIRNVIEIHETPEDNTATVEVIMERANITPFGKITIENYSLEKTFKYTSYFKKTSNGWVWDDCQRD